MQVRVVSSALTGAGAELSGAGGQIQAAEGTMAAACGSGAGAAGFPDASGALEECGTRWSPVLAQTGEVVHGLSGALTAASALYTLVDQTAMP